MIPIQIVRYENAQLFRIGRIPFFTVHHFYRILTFFGHFLSLVFFFVFYSKTQLFFIGEYIGIENKKDQER